MRLAPASALALAALLACGAAQAQSAMTEDACIASHRRTQELELAKQLLAAEREAVACSQAACAVEIREMCTDFVARIRKSQPSVVLRLRGAVDPAQVTLRIDGRAVPHRFDGSALIVDPGPHRLEYGAPGRAPRALSIVVDQGAKDRAIDLPFDDGGSGGVSAWAWVLGGLGAASLGTFAILGASTLGDADDLEAECGNRCASLRPGEVDDVQQRAVVADVFLVAGVALLAGAGVTMGLTWSSPSSSATAAPTTARLVAGPGAMRLRVDF